MQSLVFTVLISPKVCPTALRRLNHINLPSSQFPSGRMMSSETQCSPPDFPWPGQISPTVCPPHPQTEGLAQKRSSEDTILLSALRGPGLITAPSFSLLALDTQTHTALPLHICTLQLIQYAVSAALLFLGALTLCGPPSL